MKLGVFLGVFTAERGGRFFLIRSALARSAYGVWYIKGIHRL